MGTKENPKLKLMASFQDQARYKKRLPFYDYVKNHGVLAFKVDAQEWLTIAVDLKVWIKGQSEKHLK